MGPIGPIGPRGEKGETGEQGLQGIQGPKGNTGDTGPMGPVGPQGERGEKGDRGDIGPAGPSNTLSIGTVTKGDDADATITGTSPNQTLNLVLPKGDKGDTGNRGPQGIQGIQGPPGQDGAIQYTAGDGIDITNNTISALNDTYFVNDNSEQNPFVFAGKKKGVYFFNNIDYFNGDTINTPPLYFKLEASDVSDFEKALKYGYLIIPQDIPAANISSGITLAIALVNTAETNYQGRYSVGRFLSQAGTGRSHVSFSAYKDYQYVPMGFSGNISTQLAFSTLPSTSKGPTNDSHLTRKKYVDDLVATKQNVLTAGTGITITNDVISATGGVNTIEQDTNINDLDPGVYICDGNYKLYWGSGSYVQPKGILEVASHTTSTSRNFSIITKSFNYYSPTSSGGSSYPHIFVGEAPSNSTPTIKRLDTLASNDVATAYTSGLMSSTDKAKLNGISAGAEVNVQADWNESDTNSDSYIQNKPTIPIVPTNVSAFTNDAGYLTSHQDVSGKEDKTNKVTSINSSSTDTQYPSAKCVYDAIYGALNSSY